MEVEDELAPRAEGSAEEMNEVADILLDLSITAVRRPWPYVAKVEMEAVMKG